MGRRKNTIQGILSRYEIDENNCWNYTGYCDSDGYGEASLDKKNIKLHRLSYEQHYGPQRKGMMICHRCDNRRCFNPEHLYQGSAAQNNKDRVDRGRGGERKYQEIMAAKIGLDAVKITQIRSAKGTHKAVAARFGIPAYTCANIRRGQSYNRLIS